MAALALKALTDVGNKPAVPLVSGGLRTPAVGDGFHCLDFVHLGGAGEDVGELSVNCGWGFSTVGVEPRQLKSSAGQPQHEVRRFGHVSKLCTKSRLCRRWNIPCYGWTSLFCGGCETGFATEADGGNGLSGSAVSSQGRGVAAGSARQNTLKLGRKRPPGGFRAFWGGTFSEFTGTVPRLFAGRSGCSVCERFCRGEGHFRRVSEAGGSSSASSISSSRSWAPVTRRLSSAIAFGPPFFRMHPRHSVRPNLRFGRLRRLNCAKFGSALQGSKSR